MSNIRLAEGSAPATPSSGKLSIFVDSADKHLKTKDDAGTIVDLAMGAVAGWTVATETTSARAAIDGEFILVDAATCVITLPAPAGNARVAVKSIIAVVDIQIKTSGAGINIDGFDYSETGLALTTQYEQISLISDGADWWIY